MELDIVLWLNLALRWVHVIVGISWIGTSFYFVWLDNNLRPAGDGKEGVSGELWAVHGGGFYHNQKYMVAPPQLPEELHWFKWEAYFTWITGFLLLSLMYYYGADVFLIDPAKADLTQWQAIAIGLGALAGSWVVYDAMCRSGMGNDNKIFGFMWSLILLVLAVGLSSVFSGRGTFIHVGAILGTVMAANVFMVIIPNQRKVVAALKAGEAPDPELGKAAKQRSLHNNYMTLPVVFIMISNHYPLTFGNKFGWVILAGLSLSGWYFRHFLNRRNMGKIEYHLVVLGVVAFLATMVFASVSQTNQKVAVLEQNVPFAEARAIVKSHCVTCHSFNPVNRDFGPRPGGLSLESDRLIKENAARIYQQAVATQVMPMGNQTHMSIEERQKLGTWIVQHLGAEP